MTLGGTKFVDLLANGPFRPHNSLIESFRCYIKMTHL